jgi:hypothetical protein
MRYIRFHVILDCVISDLDYNTFYNILRTLERGIEVTKAMHSLTWLSLIPLHFSKLNMFSVT